MGSIHSAIANLTAFTLFLGTVSSAVASDRTVFRVNEPLIIAGVPQVTLGPGTYVLRRLNAQHGVNLVQVLSERQDYVYTSVLTIPATRLQPAEKTEFRYWETPSGNSPALRYWFPPGDGSGHEFLYPRNLFTSTRNTDRIELKFRTAPSSPLSSPYSEGLPADRYGLAGVLSRIERGEYNAARDAFRRHYPLSQSREGANASFLLALIMWDSEEARSSLATVNRVDIELARVLVRLNVSHLITSLRTERSSSQRIDVGRFLVALAMELRDSSIARTAAISYDSHVVRGDPLVLGILLDKHRLEMERERRLERTERELILSRDHIGGLNAGVLSLFNKVGALEQKTGAADALMTDLGLRVVLTERKLRELDALVAGSFQTLSQRQGELEHLISRRDLVIKRELNSLRSAVGDLDRHPGWRPVTVQYAALQNWERSSSSAVARDVVRLAEKASSPMLKPSTVLGGFASMISVGPSLGPFQINIAGILAKLAELLGA